MNELTHQNAALYSELEKLRGENMQLKQQASDVPLGTSDIAAAKIKVITPCYDTNNDAKIDHVIDFFRRLTQFFTFDCEIVFDCIH